MMTVAFSLSAGNMTISSFLLRFIKGLNSDLGIYTVVGHFCCFKVFNSHILVIMCVCLCVCECVCAHVCVFECARVGVRVCVLNIRDKLLVLLFLKIF